VMIRDPERPKPFNNVEAVSPTRAAAEHREKARAGEQAFWYCMAFMES